MASEQTALQSAAAGATSGFLSRVITFPFDTLKARIQIYGALHHGKRVRSTKAAHKLYQSEGVRGFYRGFGTIILGTIPAQALYFGGYELGKQVFPRSWGVFADLGTGCLAQLVAGVAFTPIDVVKERMQVQTMMRGQITYVNALHAFESIIASHGLIGLMRGYWATNGVWFPWNALYISLYEALKRQAAAKLDFGDGEQLPAAVTATISFSAASAATVLTHPADVVKTRLQYY